MKIRNILFPFVAGIFLTLGLLWALGGWSTPVTAASVQANPSVRFHPTPLLQSGSPIIRYVAITGTDAYTCATPISACRTVQYAVDVADADDVIKVAAGVYTDTITRTPPSGYDGPTVITQVVYINKSLTIQGGYTTTGGFAAPDPNVYTTTLDAEGEKRVILISGDITVTLENLHITGGDATGLGGVEGGAIPSDVGGGVYAISATTVLSGNVIYDNTITGGGFGGGVFLYHSDDATLHGNTVSTNTAVYGYGGGVYVKDSDDVMLSDNDVYHNIAGGPMAFGGGVYLEHSNGATLSSNEIYSNLVSGYYGFGGGVCLMSSDDAKLNGNAIYQNVADGFLFSYGGGVSLQASANIALNGNDVCNNTSILCGGIYLQVSDAKLDNNVIADNEADIYGSGVGVEGSTARLRHNTLARNTGGDGSGIHVGDFLGSTYSSTVTLTNTILVGHTVGITVANGNTATLRYTLWGTDTWANDQDWSDTENITTGTVNIWDYPNFAPDAGDYHIVAGSAAIDEGKEITDVTEDKDGVPRPWPWGAKPDLGAYEYAPADLVMHKTVTPVAASPGDTITYTLTFSNAGWYSATGVLTITDVVPVSVSVKGIISTGVTITDTSTTLPTHTWQVQDLAFEDGGVITITGVLSKPLAAGVFTNTAEITTTVVDGDAGNNSDSATVTVLPADLVIVKTVTPTLPVDPGGTITCTLTFSNAGEGLATHVFVTDVVPLSVTVKGVISTNVIVAYTSTPPTHTWEVQDLAFEAGGVITITGMVNMPLAAGTFTNAVTITTKSTDSDMTDNTSSVSVTVPNVAPVADDATYSTDKDTSIHDTLTANDANGDPLLYGIFSAPITGDVAITDTVTGSFVYTPTEHAAPYTTTFTFVVTDTADLTNTAIVTVIVTADAPVDLVIVKTVTPTTPVNPGSVIAYVLTFSNAGPGLATDIVISDTIPLSVTHTRVLSSSDVAITPVGGARYVWQVADLASGTGGVITITGVLSDSLAAGVFTNTAEITTTAMDSNPDNNRDSASVNVVLPIGGHTEPGSPLRPEFAAGWLLLAIVLAVGTSLAVQSLMRRSLP